MRLDGVGRVSADSLLGSVGIIIIKNKHLTLTQQLGQLASAREGASSRCRAEGSRFSAEVMAAVVPEEEHAPSLVVAEREAPARGEAAEVLEMGVVLGVEVEEVPARSEEAEVLGATGVVQGVVVEELEVFKFGWGIQPLALKNNSTSCRRDMLLLLVEPDCSLSAHPP